MRKVRIEEGKEISPPSVVFEDESLLVLNKPSGWIVNESKTTAGKPVIQTWVRENYRGEAIGSFEHRNGIVHRIDKETSGILLVAKTVKAMQLLQDQFRRREISKSYQTLLHGKLDTQGEILTVNVPVGRLPWNRERFGVLPGGRDAVTNYRTEKFFQDEQNGIYSMIDAMPKTGRTHQIRIHMKYLGHPVVADNFYAGRKTARKDRQWCPRLFLHAHKIVFMHPQSGKSISLEAALPEDLAKALEHLKEVSC